MLNTLELRKVIKIMRNHGIEFSFKTGGKHSGKFIKGNKSFPVKTHGLKTSILPYALKGLIKKFDLPHDMFSSNN